MKRASWLSIFILFIYFLTYAGVLHSIDEIATFSLSESLLNKSITVNRMEWEQDRYPPQNAYGDDGNLYSKKGLGTVLAVLPFLALGKQLPDVGNIQIALLTNAFIISLTIFVFYHLVVALSYSQKIATFSVLALGLGTLLWPYALMLFSEPLGALGITIALFTFIRLQSNFENRWLLLCSIGCGLIIFSRSANAILVFPFAIAILFQLISDMYLRKNLLQSFIKGLYFGFPLFLFIATIILYNYIRFETYLSFPTVSGEAFTTPLLTGLAGQLWSSGKGLIFYVPFTFMVPLSYILHFRRMLSTPYLIAISLFVIPLLFYSRWYDWPGGGAWGPRFLVPIMPAIVMLCLPTIETLYSSRSKWVKWILWVWLITSVTLQLPGVLVNFTYQEILDGKAGATYQDLLWNWSFSPLLTYWNKIFTGAANPIWLHPYFWQNSIKIVLFIAMLIVLILFLFVWTLSIESRPTTHRQWNAQLILLTALVILFGFTMVFAAKEDPRWWEETENIQLNREVRLTLQQLAQDSDIVVLDLQDNYDRSGRIKEWSNETKNQPDYIGFKRKATFDYEDASHLSKWLLPYSRVWLVSQATAYADPTSTTENWLRDWGYEGNHQWVGTQRITEFLIPSSNITNNEMNTAVFQTSPPLILNYTLTQDTSKHAILLDLAWSGDVPNLNYSIQVLNVDHSKIEQQLDRAIQINGEQKAGLYLTNASSDVILRVYDPASNTIYPVQMNEEQMDAIILRTAQ